MSRWEVYKTQPKNRGQPLAFWDGPRSVYGIHFSLINLFLILNKQKEQGSIRTFSYYHYYQWGKYFPETPRRHFLMSDGGHILHLWPNHWLEIRITWIGLGQSQISQDKGGATVAHHGGLPIWSATKGGGNLYSKGSGMIMGDIQVELKIHYILRWFYFHNPLDSSAYMSLHLSLYFENFLSDIKKAKVRLKA